VQLEGDLAGQLLALGQLVEAGVEDLRAGGERAPERLLLAGDDGQHQLVVVADDRVGVAHDLDRALDHGRQHRPLDAQQVGEADGAADDAPQHVAAVLVGGDDPVGHEERHRAGVVGDEPQGDVAQLGPAEALAGDRLGLVHQDRQRVGGVEAGAAVEHGEHALEAGTRVDVLAGQVAQRAVGVAEVLLEHEVPDLDVAGARRRVGRAAVGAEVGAVVEEDLGRRAARPGLAHLPEVVLVEPLDALAREADGLAPDLLGLVVGHVDGDPQQVGVEPQHLGDELPGPRDGLVLEVLAEAEVPQHLEEAEVAQRPADVVEVVVLAPGAHARLGRHRPWRVVRHRLLAQEQGDEGHHPRVGEHRRAGVRRDEAGRGDDGVPAGHEEVVPRLA
jgi:hypothetical protein